MFLFMLILRALFNALIGPLVDVESVLFAHGVGLSSRNVKILKIDTDSKTTLTVVIKKRFIYVVSWERLIIGMV